MKRLNPETGLPFVRGDARPDGRIFLTYQKTRVKRDGTYPEVWLSPERNAAYEDRIARWRRSNPERMRAQKHRHRYGIDAADYAKLLSAQGGRCAVCLSVPESGAKGILFVDHDHNTGAVRGLLCNSCNIAAGALETVGEPAILGLRMSDYFCNPPADILKETNQ